MGRAAERNDQPRAKRPDDEPGPDDDAVAFIARDIDPGEGANARLGDVDRDEEPRGDKGRPTADVLQVERDVVEIGVVD